MLALRAWLMLDRKCVEDHEELAADYCQGIEGGQGVCAGMRIRVYQLHREFLV